MSQDAQLLPGVELAGQSPDGPRYVLHPTVAADLRARAIDAFLSLPRRGMEIGGVLHGTVHHGEVHIEAFQEAPCEHRYGPSFTLSDTDRDQFAGLLAHALASELPPVVGLFRSYTSRHPEIDQDDRKLVARVLPHGEHLFLMLHPTNAQTCMAAFRFFRDDELLPEEGASSPLPAADLPAPAPPSPVEPAPPPLLPALPAPYRVREPASAPRWAEDATPHPSRSRWWLPVLICILSGLFGAAAFRLWNALQEPRWTELHLDAVRAGGGISITWDAAAPRLTAASRALLVINDGGARHDVTLTPAQLRAGKYDYKPAHNDVAIRLTLYSGGLGVSGDSVRVFTRNGPVDTAVIEAPRPAPAAAPPPPQPPSAAVIPPSTIHEVQPAVPEGIRARINGQIVIPVDVWVDTRGRVTRATARLDGGDSVQRYLAGLAETAARQWRFLPGRTRSGAVASAPRTIHFLFE